MKVFTYAVRSKDLTADAKRIFGDFVEEAFFCGQEYNEISGDQASRLLDDADFYEKGDSIEIPTAGEILLKLSNGNNVAISSSEWGFISNVADSIVIIERNEKTTDC